MNSLPGYALWRIVKPFLVFRVNPADDAPTGSPEMSSPTRSFGSRWPRNMSLPALAVTLFSDPSGMRVTAMPPCMSAMRIGAPQGMRKSGSN